VAVRRTISPARSVEYSAVVTVVASCLLQVQLVDAPVEPRDANPSRSCEALRPSRRGDFGMLAPWRSRLLAGIIFFVDP
jgi:hypothetical protein